MHGRSRSLTRSVTIVNPQGLHARAAGKIAGLASRARAAVWIQKDRMRVNATDIMDMLTLECPEGTRLVIGVEDPADAGVLEDMVRLIGNGFGE